MGGDLSYSAALCPASSLDPGQMGRELVPGDFLERFWGDRGAERDLRIDRWSSCVWPCGYAQAKSRSFVSPLLWDYCQRWTERGRRNSGWCFLIFMVIIRAEHRRETLDF